MRKILHLKGDVRDVGYMMHTSFSTEKVVPGSGRRTCISLLEVRRPEEGGNGQLFYC
ncbi:Uncharacterised protein [uncultured archaeon]|nr:Uncharacterised protein [uncultured archaeon]